MIFPQATMLFAGLLTPVYIYLTVHVIQTRRKVRIAVGSDHPDLLRATRAHGNFSEYVPLFLILLYLEETTVHSEWASYLLGALFLAGRLAHAWSLTVAEPRAHLAGKPIGFALRFRFYAMVHTFIILGILAVMILVQYALYMTR